MVDASAIAQLFSSLPQIMGYVQAAGYIILVLFFGSIAVKGYRGYLHGALRMLLRLGSGALALVAALPIAGVVPQLNQPLFRLFQIDMLVGGIISSIILSVALSIFSHGMEYGSIKARIKALQEKLDGMKELPKEKRKMFKIIGLVIVAAFAVFAVYSFHGLPSIADELLSSVGLSGNMNDVLKSICSQAGSMSTYSTSQQCTELMMQSGSLQGANFTAFESAALKATVEAATSKKVSSMMEAYVNGKPVVVSVLDDRSQCFSTETELCVCAAS